VLGSGAGVLSNLALHLLHCTLCLAPSLVVFLLFSCMVSSWTESIRGCPGGTCGAPFSLHFRIIFSMRFRMGPNHEKTIKTNGFSLFFACQNGQKTTPFHLGRGIFFSDLFRTSILDGTLAPIWHPFGSIFVPLGSLSAPLGSLSRPFGSFLAHFLFPLALFWLLLCSCGSLLVTL